jgi:hypothetical protein
MYIGLFKAEKDQREDFVKEKLRLQKEIYARER